MGVVATFQCYNLIGPDSHHELLVFRLSPRFVWKDSWDDGVTKGIGRDVLQLFGRRENDVGEASDGLKASSPDNGGLDWPLLFLAMALLPRSR